MGQIAPALRLDFILDAMKGRFTMRFLVRIAAIPAAAILVMLLAPSAAASTIPNQHAASALPAMAAKPVHGVERAPSLLGSGLRAGSYLTLATPAANSGNGPGSILWD